MLPLHNIQQGLLLKVEWAHLARVGVVHVAQVVDFGPPPEELVDDGVQVVVRVQVQVAYQECGDRASEGPLRGEQQCTSAHADQAHMDHHFAWVLTAAITNKPHDHLDSQLETAHRDCQHTRITVAAPVAPVHGAAGASAAAVAAAPEAAHTCSAWL